ncbi:MAG: diaminopimelate epimerase [Pirellulaceae bacterium]
MQFTKMHRVGNDYIYIDCFAQETPQEPSQLAVRMSDRHFGVGGDGLVLIEPSQRANARMRMFNADGSEAEMCGNAIRCVAKYLYDHDIHRHSTLDIDTGVGVLRLEVQTDAKDQVHGDRQYGSRSWKLSRIPTTLCDSGTVIDVPIVVDGVELKVTCVSMGNPHCVCFVPEATDSLVLGLGPKIENDPRFPRRTNVEFVEVLSRGEVRQRTWERGSGDLGLWYRSGGRLCCGGHLRPNGSRNLEPFAGGDLTLRWDDASGDMFMTGPAEEVFTGDFKISA